MMFITAGMCLQISAQTNGGDKPNIVLIVADDLGFSDIGCYGGEINTPHLDQMAEDGMRFKQFYNGGVCVVTRAMMMTGLYARVGQGGLLKSNMVTLGEVLGAEGYKTILSGKWHLGGKPTRPVDRGFDEYYGAMIGAVNFFDPTLPDPSFVNHSGPDEPFVRNEKVIEEVDQPYYATDATTDFAIEQINNCVQDKQPFFLHVAYNAPHYPLHALPEDIRKYKGKYDGGYEELRKERYERLVEMGIVDKNWPLPPTDKKLGDFRYDLEVEPWKEVNQSWESKKMEVYAAMVDRMDQNIGRLLDHLESLKIDSNTLVIFFSDNGGCASMVKDENFEDYLGYHLGKELGGKDTYALCGPGWASAQSSPFRRYKVWTYEGGISTPMIVRWPGKIRSGTWSNEVAHVVDLMPTFMDVTGASYPSRYRDNEILPLEGESMLPIFQEKGIDKDREVAWYLYGSRSIRKGKWKAVWGTTGKRWELYNMETDRTESRDLGSTYPEIKESLIEKWNVWAKQCTLPERLINP